MNSQTCITALPPTKNAGPILLAGLSDPPLTLMKQAINIVRHSPIDTPASCLLSVFETEPMMTTVKMKVATNSLTKAARRLY